MFAQAMDAMVLEQMYKVRPMSLLMEFLHTDKAILGHLIVAARPVMVVH
jgi:hypothetical protein